MSSFVFLFVFSFVFKVLCFAMFVCEVSLLYMDNRKLLLWFGLV